MCTCVCVGVQVRTHKVNGAEAAVSDFSQVGEQLLRVIFAEEVGHVGVLQIARPNTRGHGQGLWWREGGVKALNDAGIYQGR